MKSARIFFNKHQLLGQRAALALCGLSARELDIATDWRIYSQATRRKYDFTKPAGDKSFTVAEWQENQIRIPPAPFRHGKNAIKRPEGTCSLCGWPIYRGGHWRNVGNRHPNHSWHACCSDLWITMTRAENLARWLAQRQDWRCAITGESLHVPYDWDPKQTYFYAEVDHIFPLWKVHHNWQAYRWPDVLSFWMPGNLQALSRNGHKIKCAAEAKERAAIRRTGASSANVKS